MTHIWNIYEPADPQDLTSDPFDIFVYSLRQGEEPFVGHPLFIEGRRVKIIAIKPDLRRTETNGDPQECFYKVAVI